MWIDTHCHVEAYEDPSPEGVLKRCAKDGVGVVWVTTLPEQVAGFHATLASDSPPGLRAQIAAGLHPMHAHTHGDQRDALCEMIESTPLVGEVGLDGVDESAEIQEAQRRVFSGVLEACAKLGDDARVLSVHSRRAAEPVLDMLGGGFPRAVLHWFSGDDAALKRAVSERRWFSVNPAMASSAKGRKIMRALPPDRVVLESDGPYALVDGQGVTPWRLGGVIPVLASLWEQPQNRVAAQIEENEQALFGALFATTP